MNKLAVAFCLSLLTLNVHAAIPSTDTMVLPYVSVLDGDTVRTYISLPSPLNKLSIRMGGIDTPESTWRAKCPEEKVLGIKAKAYLDFFLKDVKILYVKNFKYGTYAGRIIGDVYVDINGVMVNLATVMLNMGYAKYYDGRHKPKWCK
jgi:endonuclease YncB( thermonuclease family)